MPSLYETELEKRYGANEALHGKFVLRRPCINLQTKFIHSDEVVSAIESDLILYSVSAV